MYILSVIAILLCVQYLWSRRKYYYLTWKTNGYWGYPILGGALKLLNRKEIMNRITEERQKFTSTSGIVWFGPFPYFYISDPQTAEVVLKLNCCSDKADFYNVISDSFGDGLFSLQNPRWSHHRRLFNPTFRNQIIRDFIPIFNKQTDMLMEALTTYVNQGEVDFQKTVKLFTMDVSCETTMGKEMNFLKEGNLEILKAYGRVSMLSVKRLIRFWYHNDWIFKRSSLYAKLEEARRPIRDFIRRIINQNLAENDEPDDVIDKDGIGIVKPKCIFIDQALKYFRSNELTLDEIENESNTIIVASYHSTAHTINYTLMCMAMFPEYQDKAFDEIKKIFPAKDFIATPDALTALPYLEQCLNETLRLFAPIPFIGRTAMEEFALSDGTTIPKGTQIAIDIFNMQRDERFWGPLAKIYNPGHFDKEFLAGIHPYAFVPFSKGIRNCIGVKYAMTLMTLSVARILRRYKLETNFEFKDIECTVDVMIRFKKCPQLIVTKRES